MQSRKIVLVVTGVVAAVLTMVAGMPLSDAATPATATLFGGSTPKNAADTTDSHAVEVGVKFRSSTPGLITGISFYKAATNTGTHPVTLWSAKGSKLATATVVNETASGWQTAVFAKPVTIKASTNYVASYLAPNGNYAYDTGFFSTKYAKSPLSVPSNGGIYRYGGGFPIDTWKSTNYWVDVLFTTGTSTTTTEPASSTTAPSTSTTSSTTTSVVPRTTTSTTTTPSTTTTTKAPQTTTTTSVVPPPAGGFPNASNTGYKNAPGYPGSLTTFAGTLQSNTTYKFVDFSSGLYIGSATNHPTNITFYGCRFASNAVVDANVANYGDNITFDYSSFVPAATNTTPVAYNKGYQYGIDLRYSGQMTVDHSDFWGFGNGIEFGFSSQAKPFVVKNSWFHDARDDNNGVDHTDAILSNDGGPSYVVIDHNTISSAGNTNGLALQYDHTPYKNITVTNNYFSGFGYTVNIGGYGNLSNSVFTGNTFGTDFKPVWGPLYDWGGTNNVWKNNKWHVAPGTTWSPASKDGQYWLPDGSTSSTDNVG